MQCHPERSPGKSPYVSEFVRVFFHSKGAKVSILVGLLGEMMWACKWWWPITYTMVQIASRTRPPKSRVSQAQETVLKDRRIWGLGKQVHVVFPWWGYANLSVVYI